MQTALLIYTVVYFGLLCTYVFRVPKSAFESGKFFASTVDSNYNPGDEREDEEHKKGRQRNAFTVVIIVGFIIGVILTMGTLIQASITIMPATLPPFGN